MRDPTESKGWLEAWASRLVLLSAVAVGLANLAYYYAHGLTTAHYDAKAHLVVARRLTDSLAPGYGQMGIHWLPLVHILYWPFTLSDIQYQTALIPSLISVAAFVVSACLVFRITKRITGSAAGGLIAGLLLISNSNLQYLQSCPMSEPLFMALMLLSIESFISWRESSGQALPWMTSAWISLAALCRYEGWLLLAGVIVLLAWDWLHEREQRSRLVRGALLIIMISAAPVLAHFGFAYLKTSDTFVHRVIRGNPAPSETFHDALLSLAYHLGQLCQVAAAVPLVVGIAGAVYALGRCRPLRRWAPLYLLWSPSILNISALYWGLIYRVRYSVLLLPALAVFSGILVRSEIALRRALLGTSLAAMLLPWVSWYFPREWKYHAVHPGPGIVLVPALALVLLMAGAALRNARWPLLALCVVSMMMPALDGEKRPILDETLEHGVFERQRQRILSYLGENYDGTRILLDIEKLAPLVYDSRLPVKEFLYNEGNLARWRRALEKPYQEVGWICSQREDEIWPLLEVDPPWDGKYALAVQTEMLRLYRLRREEREWLRRDKSSP